MSTYQHSSEMIVSELQGIVTTRPRPTSQTATLAITGEFGIDNCHSRLQQQKRHCLALFDVAHQHPPILSRTLPPPSSSHSNTVGRCSSSFQHPFSLVSLRNSKQRHWALFDVAHQHPAPPPPSVLYFAVVFPSRNPCRSHSPHPSAISIPMRLDRRRVALFNVVYFKLVAFTCFPLALSRPVTFDFDASKAGDAITLIM